MSSCIVVEAFLTRTMFNVILPSAAGVDFEAFLHRTAEEIIDHAVCELISEVDLIVFEEKALDVTV